MLLSQTSLWGEGTALEICPVLGGSPLLGTPFWDSHQAPSSLIFLSKGLALCLVDVALALGSSTLGDYEEIFFWVTGCLW